MKYTTIDGKQFASMLAAVAYLKSKENKRLKQKNRLWNAVTVTLFIGVLIFNFVLLFLVKGC